MDQGFLIGAGVGGALSYARGYRGVQLAIGAAEGAAFVWAWRRYGWIGVLVVLGGELAIGAITAAAAGAAPDAIKPPTPPTVPTNPDPSRA